MLVLLPLLYSCGQAYFPIELKTVSRSERLKQQENIEINLVAMTLKEIKSANKSKYIRRIIDAGDLNRPASIIDDGEALIEKFPKDNEPGPYKLGIGDKILFSQFTGAERVGAQFFSRELSVSDDGFINVYGLGKVKAEGVTQSQLEDLVYQKLLQSGDTGNFELSIVGFNSKKIFVNGENLVPRTVAYRNTPIFLEDILSSIGLKKVAGLDFKIELVRGNDEYVFSLLNLSKKSIAKYRLFPGDKIFIKPLNYRDENVLVVGETGAQKSLPISSFRRPTLSDTIFSGAILNTVTSDFSQIYVIRRTSNKKTKAYHLDITNPARIFLASKFEMRPDDIIFVAAQPLTLYSRTLQQIIGSYGLTIQARDNLRSEIQ